MPPSPPPPAPPPAVVSSLALENLKQFLAYIAMSIVRARGVVKRREVRLRKWYTAVSVVFSLLGLAGVLSSKVDHLPPLALSSAFITAIVSLIVLIGMELYRTFQIEEIALKALSASRAFSLLNTRTRHALRKPNTLEEVAKCVKQSEDLEEMFDDILPDPQVGTPEYEDLKKTADQLVESWLKEQLLTGNAATLQSQQKPKKPRG